MTRRELLDALDGINQALTDLEHLKVYSPDAVGDLGAQLQCIDYSCISDPALRDQFRAEHDRLTALHAILQRNIWEVVDGGNLATT